MIELFQLATSGFWTFWAVLILVVALLNALTELVSALLKGIARIILAARGIKGSPM